MVAEILRESFDRAHRRPGLIFLDVFWKLVWCSLTGAGVVIVTFRFVSHFEYTPINIQALDALRLAGSVQQMWSDYGGELAGGLFAVAGMSALFYLFVEAKVRRKLVNPATTPFIV